MAKTLHIAVNDKVATYCQRDGVIVCGNSDYEIEFSFDSEWDNHPAKTARFIHGKTYEDVVFEGNTAAVPIMRGVTSLSVGVFSGDLKTTTPALITCRKSILCDGGSPSAPAPDVYAQIIELLNKGGGGGSTVVGATPVFEIDEVVTLEAGERAYVDIDSTDPAKPRISFGIPKGADGIGKDGAYVTSIDEMGGDDTRTTYKMRFSDGNGYDFDVYHGTNGKDGEDGKSAYEIYLANGGNLSEPDWLASLHGKDGQDGAEGGDGADGKSAYEIAVDEGFEGTETEWLESLKGKDGTNGMNGVDGKDGKTPVKGTDYYTPEEKAELIQEILAELGAAVIGYIDGNAITLKGNLAEGTYTAYYEVEGELVEIGELTLTEGGETPVPTTYTVTFVADSVTVETVTYEAGATSIEEPAVPAKDGYTGVWESYTLNDTNLTVNAVYTAIEVEPAEPKNFAQPLVVGRLSNSAGVATDTPTHRTTSYVPVQNGDTLFVTGFVNSSTNGTRLMVFDSSQTRLEAMTQTHSFSSAYTTLDSSTTTSTELTITSNSVAYVRFSDAPSGSEDEITVNIKRNGAWLTE